MSKLARSKDQSNQFRPKDREEPRRRRRNRVVVLLGMPDVVVGWLLYCCNGDDTGGLNGCTNGMQGRS